MKLLYDNKVTVNPNTSIPDINKIKSEDMNIIKSSLTSGWIFIDDTTASYVSWDSTTNSGQVKFNGDATSYISEGMKFKWTQDGATKFAFFTSNGTFADGYTTYSIYGGTDYVLTNTVITNPYFSTQKQPFAFPSVQNKWTITKTITTTSAYSNLAVNDIKVLNNCNISVPVGSWRPFIQMYAYAQQDEPISQNLAYNISLTSDSSTPNKDYINRVEGYTKFLPSQVLIENVKPINLSVTTTFYLIVKFTIQAKYFAVENFHMPIQMSFVCAYL